MLHSASVGRLRAGSGLDRGLAKGSSLIQEQVSAVEERKASSIDARIAEFTKIFVKVRLLPGGGRLG